MLNVVFHFYHRPGEIDSWGAGAVDEVRLTSAGYEVLINKRVIATWSRDKVQYMYISPSFAYSNGLSYYPGVAA